MSTPLILAEELVLLGHDGSTGRRIADGTGLTVATAGSLIADLALAERIDLDSKRVAVLSPAPVGDSELDGILAWIAAETRPRKPEWLISKLNKRDLPKRIQARLATRGIVRAEEHRALGMFPYDRYPQLDPRPGQEARGRMWEAINGAAPTPHTAALIALTSACRLDRKIFPDVDRRLLKRRAKEISEGEWAGAAVRKVIQSINAAAAGAAAAAASAGAAGSS
jgi:hypothetical protein